MNPDKEKLKEAFDNKNLELIEYSNELEDRIDKAIEKLGEWTIFETSAYTDKIISETLDILKGVDKE